MTPAAVKPPVPFSVLEKLDIRLGSILAVEELADSRKLVELTVDFGDHVRKILSGMKGEREDIQTLFVVNLEPRRMAGRVSEGMLLDLGYADGLRPALALPEHPLPNGARAG